MVKTFAIISLFAFSIGTASAQTSPMPVRPRATLGAEIGIPAGMFAELFKVGFGGSGKLEIPITSNFYGTATAGFISFYNKNRTEGGSINDNNRSYVPLKIGGKYYLGEFLYTEVEAGAAVGIQKSSGNYFAWAPGLGVAYPITQKSGIDVGVRYEKWSKSGRGLNQVGLRIAYQF